VIGYSKICKICIKGPFSPRNAFIFQKIFIHGAMLIIQFLKKLLNDQFLEPFFGSFAFKQLVQL
jgi:hypothetical protein